MYACQPSNMHREMLSRKVPGARVCIYIIKDLQMHATDQIRWRAAIFWIGSLCSDKWWFYGCKAFLLDRFYFHYILWANAQIMLGLFELMPLNGDEMRLLKYAVTIACRIATRTHGMRTRSITKWVLINRAHKLKILYVSCMIASTHFSCLFPANMIKNSIRVCTCDCVFFPSPRFLPTVSITYWKSYITQYNIEYGVECMAGCSGSSQFSIESVPFHSAWLQHEVCCAVLCGAKSDSHIKYIFWLLLVVHILHIAMKGYVMIALYRQFVHKSTHT